MDLWLSEKRLFEQSSRMLTNKRRRKDREENERKRQAPQQAKKKKIKKVDAVVDPLSGTRHPHCNKEWTSWKPRHSHCLLFDVLGEEGTRGRKWTDGQILQQCS